MTYPREIYGSAISDELKTLVHTLAFRLLDGATQHHTILRRQLVSAVIDHVTLTGAGLYAYFTVPADAPSVSHQRLIGGLVEISSAALDAGGGALICVTNGRLDFVEIYTFGNTGWPDIPLAVSLGAGTPLEITEAAS